MQGHNIYESGVDFRVNRKLTIQEIQETISYCRNDVEETINLFTELRGDFDVQLELINEFNLELSEMSKTNSQTIATILGAVKREYTDEFDLNFPAYLDKVVKYRSIVDWYRGFKTAKKFTDEDKDNYNINSACILLFKKGESKPKGPKSPVDSLCLSTPEASAGRQKSKAKLRNSPWDHQT
jgi:hypothetical protein